MTYDLTTIRVLIALISIIVVYDVCTLLKRGAETTLSVQLYRLSMRFPIIPFIFGVVAGHLFWAQHA